MDYVILHELTHTRVHNHSRKFWAELDKYVKTANPSPAALKQTYAPALMCFVIPIVIPDLIGNLETRRGSKYFCC